MILSCLPFLVALFQAPAQTQPGQPPAPKYRFEVASIKPAAPDQNGTRIMPGPQGGLRMENVTVMQMITLAYEIRDFQVVGGPAWIRTDHFDITGTPDHEEEAASPTMGREKLQSMFGRQRERVQALLQERFSLVLQSETRTMPIYELVVAKGGPKLTESSAETAKNTTSRMSNGSMTATGTTMDMLANTLASMLRRPVTNATGLTGIYDLKLNWTPDASDRRPGAEAPAAPVDGGPSIFTALQEQLGLKVESKKGPAIVFVVEKAEKPSAN